MKTGEIIGLLAQKKGLNLHQLAINAEIPYNTLYAIVRRKSAKVDNEALQRIASALGVPITDLLTSPPPPEITFCARKSTRVNAVFGQTPAPELERAEFSEFDRFIETMGYHIHMDGGNYHLRKGKKSVVITPDQLRGIVRFSRATVAALVQDLMETAAPVDEMPQDRI